MHPNLAFERSLDLEQAQRRPRAVFVQDTPDSSPLLLKLQRALLRQWPVISVILGLSLLAAAAQIYFGVPRPLAVIAGALAIGGTLALLVAAGRETWRDAIDFNDLHERLRVTVLGAAPNVAAADLRQLPPDKRSPVGLVMLQPAAAIATAFRDLQHALPDGAVISFISPLPGAGATSAAMCAAISATQHGRNVILVDCDLRHRSLTKALAMEPEDGLLEACEDPDAWRDYVIEEPETGLHVLPAARARSPWASLMAEAGFPLIIDQLREAYDLVLLDCPPAIGAAEGALLARLAERRVIVAAWDETPFSALRNALRSLKARPMSAASGVLMNRAPAGQRIIPERAA
ncbi:MAG: CpsD/CapB family tyrosine-protein kinase [Hyphomonadaceae bacterium]